MYVERHIAPRLLGALGDTPVVLVVGARQAGKSTLAKQVAAGGHPARYLTLDNATVRSDARADPTGFVNGLSGPAVIDEVQREPDLLLAIKESVDRDRRPGRFLLTGSADVLMLPKVSESLAGRVELLTIWPLSQGEIAGTRESLVDRLFEGRPPDATGSPEGREALADRLVKGGFPEAVGRKGEGRRADWFDSYIDTTLRREVRDIANIQGLTELPQLLRLLAARVGGLLNVADVGRALGIAQTSLRRYLAMLEALFLVRRVPAWRVNLGQRLIKSPKLYMVDSGLLAHLLGAGRERLLGDGALLGRVLESFVALEIVKQATWSKARVRLYHHRTVTGREIDLLLEDAAGRVVGIEVKASETVRADDFRALREMRDRLGDRFAVGAILYTGGEALPFGDRLHALPLRTLWSASA